MTREGFIKKLDDLGYSYVLDGDKIVVTHYTNVYLNNITELPDNVCFANGASVYLSNLVKLSKGLEFRNLGSVNMSLIKDFSGALFANRESVWTESFNNINWECNIPGIRKGVLFGLMVKRGLI